MSKPEIKIKGKVQNLQKTIKNEKPKQTNFLLTINTNQQYKEDDKNLDNDIEIFDHTINNLLSNINDYIKLPENDKWDNNKIKDVNIDYTVEKGLKKNEIHVHIMLKIKHFTKIQLDYDKIKNKICHELGLNNVYM